MNRLLDKNWFEILSRKIDQWTGVSPEVFGHVLYTVAVIILMALFRRIFKQFWVKNINEANRRYVVAKFINYILGFIALLVIARIWISDDINLMTYFGILSAGIAIALQDLITNLAGWLFIIIRQPFRVGDRVQVGDQAGDVIDVRLFMFSVLEIGKWVDADQSTGRIIHIPNGKVFKDPLFNYTQGFEYIWNEISVTVTFESNWKRAQDILERIASAHSEPFDDAIARQIQALTDKYRIHFTYQPPATWISVIDFGVKITIRHLCHPLKRRGDTDRIWKAVLDAFAEEPSIDFAYPTQRFYDNRLEGKPEAGGPPEPRG
jgi:small-conductance mechanosensitive channel